MTGCQETFSWHLTRHGEARLPLTLNLLITDVARASSETGQTHNRTLKGGGNRFSARAGGKAGSVGFRRLHVK